MIHGVFAGKFDVVIIVWITGATWLYETELLTTDTSYEYDVFKYIMHSPLMFSKMQHCALFRYWLGWDVQHNDELGTSVVY